MKYFITFLLKERKHRDDVLLLSYKYKRQYNYTPGYIYRGMEKVGSVRGYYKNTLIKYAQEFLNDGRPYFLKYELTDSTGNVRLHAKMSSFWKSEISVYYVENSGNKAEILMENMKDVG